MNFELELGIFEVVWYSFMFIFRTVIIINDIISLFDS